MLVRQLRAGSDGVKLKKNNSRPRLTDAQYLRELQDISYEVLGAIAVFHTQERINQLALKDEVIREALDSDAEFWNVIMHSLQTTLFITLSRIFDTHREAHSIHQFVKNTLGNYQLFSRNALKARKINMNGGVEPEWLQAFLNDTWEPNSASDLRPLKKALAPYAKKFEEVYRPIRHIYIAHRLANTAEVMQLFQRTNRAELGEVLDFLHDLTDSMWQLYGNGIKPELGSRSAQYKTTNQQISEQTEHLISKLLNKHYGRT